MIVAMCVISFIAGYAACYALTQWVHDTDHNDWEQLGHDRDCD